MTNLRRALVVAVFAVTSLSDGQQTSKPRLRPVAFLSRRWVCEKGAVVQAENWSPASGNSMIGNFRIVQDDKPIFYEFWVVEVDENRPVLKLKHFNPDLASWEDKNAITKMPLISHSENDAVFAEADGSVSLHHHRMGDALGNFPQALYTPRVDQRGIQSGSNVG